MIVSNHSPNCNAGRRRPTWSLPIGCVLVALVASQIGCSRWSQHPSVGDWMRGNHKPITPDESAFYPPPTTASVSSTLQSSAVHLDGSVPPEDNFPPRYALPEEQFAQTQRYTSRQFPSNYGQGSNYSQGNAIPNGTQRGYPTSNYQVAPQQSVGNVPSQVISPPNFQFSAPQGPPLPPGSTVDPSLRPAQGQANNYAPPQPPPGQYQGGQYTGGQYQGGQYQGGQYQSGQASAFQNPSVGQNSSGGVQYTPNTTPFNPNNVQPQFAPPGPLQTGPSGPTFVPGAGVNFPPQGYEPIYTPTLRDADLIINGFPARTGRIMFGGAVNSDAGVTGQITVDERNFDIRRWPTSFQQLFSGQAFRGAGETFRIEAAPGSDFDRYTVQWATPNLFNYLPFSFSVSGFLFDRRFNDWDEQRKGARTSLGYRITPDLSLSVGISGQEVEVTNPRNTLSPQLNRVLGANDLFSGSISLKHDTRNSPIQASSGHYFEATFEESFGDFDYSRFELEFRQYWQLAERIDGSGKQTLSYSTKVGFSGDDTPVFENFFAGGYATLRGFDFRGASPVDSGVEVGGRFQWLNTLEYMFPITADDAFRGVGFVDFGTVESDIEINEDNFRVAPGFGLRVAIPALGPAPLAFDFAFPVAKADTDDERMFSFYMSLIR